MNFIWEIWVTLARDGITTFTAANTQTGNLNINGGKLILAGSLMSRVITLASNTVLDVSGPGFAFTTNQTLAGVGSVIGTLYDNDPGATDSKISPGGDAAVGTLTLDGLNLGGNSLALNFNLASVTTVGSGVNDLIIVTNLALSGGNTNLVNFTFSGTPAAGAYTLIQYPLGQGPAAGPITTLAAAASRSTYNFTSTGTNIQVTVVANPAPLVWRGDGVTNKWDLNTSSNWINGASKDVFLTGDNATFNDSGSNTPSINLAASIPANQVTVAGTKDYTFSGVGKYTGGGKLIKTSSGSLTILTPNDNTGGGSLAGGPVTVGNGGTTVANLGTGVLTNNTKVTYFQNASVTYAGNMTGTGALVAFMPASTLTLTGTNTFTGGFTVVNGIAQIGNNTVGVSPSVTGNITNYSTLNIYRSDIFTNQNNITSAGNTLEYGNGDVQIRGAGGMTVDASGSINLMPQGSLQIGVSQYGKLTVNTGAVINLGSGLFIGNQAVAASGSDYIQNGGTVTANGSSSRIGHWASEMSTFTMNGGAFNAPNFQLGVGWDGIGLMYMNGGTVNVRTLNIDDNGVTAAIGTPQTNSTFTMTGGTVSIGSGGIGGNSLTNALVPTIILSGGTLAAAAPAGWSDLTMNLRLTNGTVTIDTSNAVVVIGSPTNVISGNGGLTKQGTGFLNLNNPTNTYTGPTTVAAGTLQGSGVIVSPITVNSGANLSAGATLATGTLTVSNATLNSGANLVFDLNSASSASDLLYARGTLALNSTPVIFNFLNSLPLTNVTYTIISNLVARTGSLVNSTPTRYNVNLDQSQATRVQVTFTGTNAALVWQGGVSTNWNVNTESNWLNNGVADRYLQADSVIFDNTGIAKSNVNLTTLVTPASVTVNSAGDYTFAGNPIGGVSALTKSGSGKLTLINSNSFTGVTTIANGTLQIGNGGVAGYLNSSIINDYASLVYNRSDTVNLNGVISGPGRLTQAGSGTLLVTATQNHYGGSTINAGGTIQLGNGALADTGSLGNGTVTNNGTVVFYRLSSIAVATPYTGNGAFIFQGTGGNGQSAYALNATNTFTGPVTINLARIQSGAGAQSFGSPSSITVNPGSAVYAVANAQSPTFSMPLTLAGAGWQDGLGALRMEGIGTWAGNITLAANARIATTSATTNVVTGTISGNYELETYGNNAAGAVLLAPSAANTYNALRVSIGTAGTKTIAGNNNAIPNNIPLTMNGGTLWLNGFSKTFSSFLNLSSSSSLQNGSSTTASTATLTPVLGSSTYNGTFADGATQPLNVTMTQTPGLWALTLGAQSPNWTGNLTNNGGTITVGTGSTYFGSQGVVARSIVGNNGATFVTTINNALNGYSGNVVLNNSTWICNRYISFAPIAGFLYLANSTLTGTNNTDGTGYANWQLPSTVTVRGNAPSYMIGGGNSLGYDLVPAGTTFDVADVTGNANADLIVGGGTSTAFIRNQANSSTASSLIKTGAGTLELDGFNTYTGPTVINAGTLVVGPSPATIGYSSSIAIGSGATLDATAAAGLSLAANQTLSGSGTLTGGLSDSTSTVIVPGTSGTAGTLTINGNLTLNGSGSLSIDLANTTTVGSGVNDLIQVNGALSLNDSAPTPVNFNFLNGAPTAGTYTIANYSSLASGSVAGLTNLQGYAVTFTVAGGVVQATFAAAPAQPLVWQGDGSGNAWDISTTSLNWSNTAALTLTNFYQLDVVRFDNSSANTTVNLGATVTPAAVTVDSTNSYTLTGSGTIAGTTGITKNNTNTLTLATANTFTGPIKVNAGVLTSGNNSALPQNASVIITNGAQFDFAGFGNSTTRNYAFTIGGSGPDGSGAINNTGAAIYGNASVASLTLTTNATIGGAGRWDIGSGQTNTVLNGNGYNLTKVGAFGTSIRPQLLTNVASIIVSNGNAWYEAFNQTNAWTATTTNYIRPGTIIGNYNGLTVNVPIVLDNATIRNEGGSGTPVWTGGIVVSNTAVFNNGAVQSFNGVVSGPGAISINGGVAALLISNANTYTGGTIISNAPVSTASVNATSGTAAVVAANPAAFGTGPITISGLGQVALTTNTVYFNSNVLRAVEFAFSAPATVANNIVLPSTVITNVSLHGRDSSQIVNLTGQISGGFTGLTNWIDFGDASSVGVMRYANAANNFLGNITAFRGFFAITADGVLGNAANVLKLNQGAAGVTGTGLRFDAANINVAHSVNLSAGAVIKFWGDNNGDGVPETMNSATISGSMSGAGTMYLVGTNATLTLAGLSPMSSGMEIASPMTLQASAMTNLGTGYIGLKQGGTFRYTGTGSETTTRSAFIDTGLNGGGGTIDIASATGSLTWNLGGGTISQNLTKIGLGTLTLGGTGISGGVVTENGGTLIINSVISGTFTPINVSSGTLVLNAANTAVGGVNVSSGNLFLNGSLAIGNPVSINSSGTLAGNGTINAPLTLQIGGALNPGSNTVGKLTVNSTVNLLGTTTMELNKAANTNDSIAGISTVYYGGSLVVNNLGGTLASGDKFTLFSAANRVGAFSSITLPTLPGGLGWSTNLLTDGSIQVVTSVNTGSTNMTATITGNQLVLTWPTDHTGWKLQAQTNGLGTGLNTNWVTIPNTELSNSFTNTINPASPAVFFRMVYP